MYINAGKRKTHCIRGHIKTPDNVSKNGTCLKCSTIASKTWREENPEQYKINGRIGSKRWRKNHPQKSRETDRKQKLKKYGLTIEQWDKLIQSQDNKCILCSKTFDRENRSSTPHLDHNHACCSSTNKTCGKCIRGALCQLCNLGLGAFCDNVEVLTKAIQYLNNFKEIVQ